MRISTVTLTLTVEHDCGDDHDLLLEAITNSISGLHMELDEDSTSRDMPVNYRVMKAESDWGSCSSQTLADIESATKN